MSKIKILLIVIQLFLYQEICASIYYSDISRVNNTDITLTQQNDSTLVEEYLSIVDLSQGRKREDFEKALNQGLKLYEKVEGSNTKLEFDISLVLGNIYIQTENYKESLKYSKKSLASRVDYISKNNNLDIDTDYYYAINLLGIASAYQQLEEKDSALIYYKKLESFKSNNTNVVSLKSVAYGNLINLYSEASMYNEAINYSKRAITIQRDQYKKSQNGKMENNLYDESEHARALSNSLAGLSVLTLKQKKYKLAKKYSLEALKLIEKDTNLITKRVKIDLYDNIALIMHELKDYNAYVYQKKSSEIKDSLRGLEYQKAIKTIGAEHNVTVAKKLVRKEEEIKRQKAIATSWIIAICSVFIIILLLSLISFYKLKQKRKIEKLESESELQILQASIDATQSERKRISQELHDGILGRLFGTRIALGFLQCEGDDITKQKQALFLEELQDIEAEIRDVSHKLSNDLEDTELNFANVVNQLLKEKSFIGNFEFLFNVSNNIEWESISGLIRINLYRVLQECIQNIIKHAQAKQVVLEFSINKEQLEVVIKDDGVGFTEAEKNDGIGMKNIYSRINDLKGTLVVQSKKGKGTSINISLPYKSVA